MIKFKLYQIFFIISFLLVGIQSVFGQKTTLDSLLTRLTTESHDSLAMATILSDIGRTYWKQGRSFEALKYHLQVKTIGEKINSPKALLRANLSLGIIENEHGNNEKAKKYYQAALLIADSLKRNSSKGLLLNNLGKAYQDDEAYEIAFQYFMQADSIFTVLDYNIGLSLVSYHKGKNYTLQNFLKKGIDYYLQALKINEGIEDKEREAMIKTALAIAYQKNNQVNLSINTAKNALSILKEVDTNLHYDELYRTLAESYELSGDYYHSLKYSKAYLKFKEENDEIEENKKIASLNHLNELQKKENSILVLKTKNIEKDKKIRESTYNAKIRGFALVVLFFLFLSLLFASKLNELRKMDKLRSNLANDLHDNIGTALNHIKMLSNRIKKEDVNVEERRIVVTKIKNISNELLYNMHDLVWSLDKRKESMADLLERIQSHADNSLGDFYIPYQFTVDLSDQEEILPPKVKINTFLIFKESLNNILKHTKTDKVDIAISNGNNSRFKMLISNYYINKKEENKISTLKGIKSMKERAKELGGQLNIVDNPGNFIVEFIL